MEAHRPGFGSQHFSVTEEDLALLQAVSALETFQYRAALDSAIAVLEANSEHLAALEIATKAFIGLYEPKRALDTAKRLVDLAPDHWGAYLLQAEALLAGPRKNGPVAIEVATRATEIAPEEPRAHEGLAIVASRVAHKSGIAKLAVARALELDPDSVKARWVIGDLHVQRYEFKEAVVVYEDALRLSPGHQPIMLALAHAQRASGRAADASETYEQLKRLEPPGTPLPNSTVLNQPEAPVSAVEVAGLAFTAYRFFVLFVVFMLSFGIVAAVKPVRFFLVLTVLTSIILIVAPLRTRIATKISPMRMGLARAETTWVRRNPDIVRGLVIVGLLLTYLAIAAFS